MNTDSGESRQQLLQTAVSHHQSGRTEQAKVLYEQVLAIDSRNPDALHLLGLLYFHTGNPEQALQFISKAIEQQSGFPPYHDNLAMVCMSTEQFEAALSALRTAEKLEGKNAHRYFNIGVACERLGRRQEAESAYRDAVRLEPRDSDFHFNLGNLLLADGRSDEAADSYRSALRCDPQADGAQVNLANICLESGHVKEAVGCFQTLVRRHPDDPDMRLALGRALVLTGRFESATREFTLLLDQDPANAGARHGLASALRYLDPKEFRADLEKHILALLETKGVHPQSLARIAANQLCHKYGFDQGFIGHGNGRSIPLAQLSQDRLLTGILTLAINTDPVLEAFLVSLRQSVLDQFVNSRLEDTECLELAVALAEQGFSNEYLHRADARELAGVQRLVEQLSEMNISTDGMGEQAEAAVVCVAMYRPVAELGIAAMLADIPLAGWSWKVRPLVARVLLAPRQEALLREQIPLVGIIEDLISCSVRQQYEQNPYPRWRSLHVEKRASYGRELKRLFPHFQPEAFLEQPVNVLAAGCGTGQEAAAIAGAHPDCAVTGLDLSRSSLAYGVRMAKEMNMRNLDFIQGDISGVSQLNRHFQVIECTGVLHHMGDPESGWHALTECLDPGGVMKIGLYSELASKEVNTARALIAERGIQSSPPEMQNFRREILAAEPGDALYPLRFSEDLYTLSACRDLLFHVHEQCFTASRISGALDTLGLDFIGFEHADPGVCQRYREFNPEDLTLTDLAAWARFEAKYPDTFSAMYVFWCCKRK